MANEATLVVGASSAIAQALIRAQHQRGHRVIAISRRPASGQTDWLQCDYSDAQIADTIHALRELNCHWRRVFICNGVLHDEQAMPEKRLEDLSSTTLQARFLSNSILPAMWLQALLPLLRGKTPCTAAVLSARIGSIADNQLGGWYSYRASKAALNMLLKTAAIEFSRRAKNIKLIAFHPGTTDSPLSAPFQHSVADDALFTPEFVAERLLSLCDAHSPDGQLSYLDWAGKPIAW